MKHQEPSINPERKPPLQNCCFSCIVLKPTIIGFRAQNVSDIFQIPTKRNCEITAFRLSDIMSQKICFLLSQGGSRAKFLAGLLPLQQRHSLS